MQGREPEVKTYSYRDQNDSCTTIDSFHCWKPNEQLKRVITLSRYWIQNQAFKTVLKLVANIWSCQNIIPEGRSNLMNHLYRLWRSDVQTIAQKTKPSIFPTLLYLPRSPSHSNEHPRASYLLSAFSEGYASLCSLDTTSRFPILAVQKH